MSAAQQLLTAVGRPPSILSGSFLGKSASVTQTRNLAGDGNVAFVISGNRATYPGDGTSPAHHSLLRLTDIDTGADLATPDAGYIDAFVQRTSGDGNHLLGFVLGVTDWGSSTFSGWRVAVNGWDGSTGYNYVFLARTIAGTYQGETVVTASGQAPGMWLRARIDGDRVRAYCASTQAGLSTATASFDRTVATGTLVGSVGLLAGVVFLTPYIESVRVVHD